MFREQRRSSTAYHTKYYPCMELWWKVLSMSFNLSDEVRLKLFSIRIPYQQNTQQDSSSLPSSQKWVSYAKTSLLSSISSFRQKGNTVESRHLSTRNQCIGTDRHSVRMSGHCRRTSTTSACQYSDFQLVNWYVGKSYIDNDTRTVNRLSSWIVLG